MPDRSKRPASERHDGPKLIPLRHKGEVVAHAKVDDADYEALNAHRWRLHVKGYAMRSSRPGVLMHRELLGLTSESGHAHKGNTPEVDHINHDKLDNRRSNLRVVDRRTNNDNREPYGKSGIKYVHWKADRQKWLVRVTEDGQQVGLGLFATKEEAAARVRQWEDER